MATPLNSLESYNRANDISTDEVTAPELTDDGDWGPPIRSFMQNINDAFDMQNGEVLIGHSAVASIANPTLTPTATTDSSGLIPAGSYDLKFTLIDGYGETAGSSAQHFNFASANNRIHTPAIALPTGALGVKWYLSDGDGSTTLRFVGQPLGGGPIYVTSLPSSIENPIPTTNTTGAANFPVKATPGAGTGLQVQVGAGSFSYLYSPTGNVDQNGFQMLRFCLENINNVDLPNLTSADKGRMVFVPDIPTVKVWNGTGWDAVGGTLFGSAGGDLSSNYPNPTVVALQGRPVAADTPATGQFLGWNGSSWTPQSATITGNATQIRGRNVSTTAPAVNQVLGWDGTSWVPVSVANANGGTVGGISVVGTPSTDQVLKYNGTAWVPADVVAATGNASSIGGFDVSTATPADGDVLTWNNATSLWEPGAASGADAVTLQGHAVNPAAPTTGQVLEWNGLSWAPTTPSAGGSNADHIQGIPVYNGGTPATGSYLVYNTVVGGQWAPAPLDQSGIGTVRNYAVNGSFDMLKNTSPVSISAQSTFQEVRIAPRWTVLQGDPSSGTNTGTATFTASDGGYDTKFLSKISRYLDFSFTNSGSAVMGLRNYFRLPGSIGADGTTITVSYLVKADAVYNITANIYSSAGAKGINQTLTTSTTWQKLSYTLTVGSVASGEDLCATIILPNGTHHFYITGVQIEDGSIAHPLEKRTLEEERRLVAPYYQNSYNNGDNVGTLTTNGAYVSTATKAGAVDQYVPGTVELPTEMVSNPTVTLYNPVTSSSNQVYSIGHSADCTGSATNYVGKKSFAVHYTGPSGGAVGDVVAFHWEADADTKFN